MRYYDEIAERRRRQNREWRKHRMNEKFSKKNKNWLYFITLCYYEICY